MKLVYFGYDPLFSCLPVFLQQGYEFAAIYTGENGEFSDKVIEFAHKNGIQLCFDKPTAEHMQDWVEQGVELFFSAEYPWKIPVPKQLKYAVNHHPTLLPEGRGMTPLPHLLLQYPQHAGITLHKLDNQFDTGDILLQQPILLDELEDFDSLSAKIYQQSPALLTTLLQNIENVYLNAKTQGEGCVWPMITKQQQSLDWRQSTADLLKQLRAFGSLGCYAMIEGKTSIITKANGKPYHHQHQAGQVILSNAQCVIIATIDGELSISKSGLTCL
jgi:methionyl-tRNA formyltransferase